MYWRSGIWIILVTITFESKAQRDSVLLNPVEVYGLRDSDFLTGSRTTRIDSTLISQQNSHHLGELISFQIPVYFRNYGNGMLSGISMRGTSPQHVAVTWNGININSFSLGQSDFSMLPGVAFDQVEVHEGGGSARFGSGAFGGSVLLSSGGRPHQAISFNQDFGSFGRYFASMKANFSHQKFSSTSSFYHLQAKNDFPILGTELKQSHAAFEQNGFVQSFQYNFSPANRITINYWFHKADREIQPTVGNTTSQDQQEDINHRAVISFQHNGLAGTSKLSAGFVDDVIVFNGSKSEVKRWISTASQLYTFRGQWNASVDVSWNHIIGKIKEYGPDDPVENRVDLSASLLKSFGRISTSVNLKQPFITNVKAPLLPYVGVTIDLIGRKRSVIKLLANASRNFRAPTLNDRYWQDLGNKDLLPETSNAGEMGLSWSYNDVLTLSATGFYQHIDEWIQWVPDSEGMFRPHNIKTVVAKGVETYAEGRLKLNEITLFGRITYQLTSSKTTASHFTNINDVDKQLIYTPVHTGSAIVQLKYSTWSFSLYGQYSGKRYTETSNSPLYALDAFVLADAALAKSWQIHRHDFNLSFTIKNFFNSNYKLYEGRAMPGTNFNFKLSYQLKRKTS